MDLGKKLLAGFFQNILTVLSVAVKIDGSIILAVLVYFKTTAEIHDMMTDIHSMAEVENVRYAETVDIIRDNKNQIAKTVAQLIAG